MNYVIYADVYLIWLYIINCLTYFIACKITDVKIALIKLMIWCSIPSLILTKAYINILYKENLSAKFHYIIVNILLFIIFVVFILKQNSIRDFFIFTFYNVVVTLALAGGVQIFVINQISIYKIMPLIIILCLTFVIIHLFCSAFIRCRKNIYQITLETCNQAISTIGYIDTGNNLRDPYSGNPVIILDYRILKGILTEKNYEIIQKYAATKNIYELHNITIDGEMIYPLPYRTISNEFSIMPAFKLKCMHFKDRIYKNIVAAISPNTISMDSKYLVLLNNNL